MPVTSAQLTPAILSQLGARAISGPYAINLATAVATAVETFVQTLVVTTKVTGILGVGTGTGKWLLDPASGSNILFAELKASGISGIDTLSIAQGIAFGSAQVINTSAIVQTAVAGIATGFGTGQVTNANAIAATTAFSSALTAQGIVGAQAPSLASALGRGVAQWFATGRITTAVAGTPTVPPAVGQGVGTGSIV